MFAPLGAIASGIACAIGFGMVGGLMTWLVMAKAFAVMFVILFFVIFATAQGELPGFNIMCFASISGATMAMPLNYVRFLNTTSDYVLLRRVGGGYMFTHRLLVDYFAHLYQANAH